MSDSKDLKKEKGVVSAAPETDVKEKEAPASAPDTKSEVAPQEFETEIKETEVSDTKVYEEYEEAEELTIFAVNRDLKDDIVLTCDIGSFAGYDVVEHLVLECDDLKATNSADAQRVAPKCQSGTTVDGRTVTASLHKASWNVIRLAKR